MNQNTLEHLNRIIALAIEGERDAAAFYRSLSDHAAFSAQKELLESYAEMEEGHAQALSILQSSGFETLRLKQEETILSLDIHHYLSAPTWDPSRNLTFQDINHWTRPVEPEQKKKEVEPDNQGACPEQPPDSLRQDVLDPSQPGI